VANVSSWNWFPAKNFVLSAVRDAEKKTHVPVYLDFEGTITRPPWKLSGNGSTVMVFDASGAPLRTWTGLLSDADFEALSGVLEPLIR
jgi:predicted transcriptional regulator